MGLASALAMKGQRDAAALKMLNSTTETMPVTGFYIPDAELRLWDRARPCAYVAQGQSSIALESHRVSPMEVHLEAMEVEDKGKASPNSALKGKEVIDTIDGA